MTDEQNLTRDDHRRAAESDLEGVSGYDEGAERWALLAIAHALLAGLSTVTVVEQHPKPDSTVTWPGFAALAVLCATVVAVVWMLK